MEIICPFCKTEVAGWYPFTELGDDQNNGLFICSCERFVYDQGQDETDIFGSVYSGYPNKLIDELMKFKKDTPIEILYDFLEQYES